MRVQNSPFYLVVALLCLSCSSESVTAPTTGSAATEPLSDVQSRYLDLRAKAIEGGPEEKFEAYFFVYENSDRLPDAVEEAVGFLVESANDGYDLAQFNLGFILQSGEVVEADQDTALHWFIQAARQGNLRAQLWCGLNLKSRFLATEDESERATYATQTEFWLRTAISSTEDHTVEVLLARTSLGQILLAQSIESEEGWQLLRDAAGDGFDMAQDTLDEMTDFLKRQLAEGSDLPAEDADRVRALLNRLGAESE